MATVTAGTLATTTFANALQSAGISNAPLPAAADIATLNNAVVNDQDPALGNVGIPGTVGSNMQTLTFPGGRGTIRLLPGDWVGVSPAGFPYLIPGIDLATTVSVNGTPISGSKSMAMASSVLVAGWEIGGVITGTGIAASTTITNISSDGKTVTMSNAATSSPGSTAISYGSWTHS